MGDGMKTGDRVPLTKTPRHPVVIEIRGWYPIVMVVVVMILITAGNIAYTNHVDDERRQAEREALAAVQRAEREADRRWCKLMGIMNDAYNNPATPPSTPLGVEVAKAVREIYMDLGC